MCRSVDMVTDAYTSTTVYTGFVFPLAALAKIVIDQIDIF